ncbi:hypothetical protein WICPIJ_008477 [Wickerhamomyces pijperi]|uniref:Uncharacterized protein n=1 Tax=Wickerhamomyces pijperi TaxID=599730 RepID=A0A9P8TIV4_WICPI|nr:hypothetical protein WICPIJ_008477 [Wickerhamomyces pijperi]
MERHDVTVQVWHNHDDVVVLGWLGDNLQGGVVDDLEVKGDVWEGLGDFLGGFDEQTVRELHDGGLVDNQDLLSVDGTGVFESVLDHLFGGFSGDKLDGLDDTWDNGVFDTGVFTFGVFSDQDGVDVFVWGGVTFNGLGWSDVGEKIKGLSQGQVQRSVTLTDWGGQWAFQGNQVLVDGVNGGLWNGSVTVLDDWGNVTGFPFNWNLSSSVDLLDGLGDFDTDTVTFDERDNVVTVSVLDTVVLGDVGSVRSGGGEGGSSGE